MSAGPGSGSRNRLGPREAMIPRDTRKLGLPGATPHPSDQADSQSGNLRRFAAFNEHPMGGSQAV